MLQVPARVAPVELLKKMVRSIGFDPDKVLVKEALAESHKIYTTPQEREEAAIASLTRALVEAIRDQPIQASIPRAH